MTHLKKLGLVVAAVAAMMAFVGAGSASAAEFHTNKVGAKLSGTQATAHEFVVQGSKVTCAKAEFSGETIKSTDTAQTMQAVYKECTGFGLPATVEMNGCDYNFTSNGGVVHLVCPPEKNVTIRSTSFFGTCHVDVAPQNSINGQSYTNSADKKTMTVHTASTNVNYNVTTSTGVCPLEVKSGTDAKYNGSTTVTAGGSTIWWE